MKLLTREQINKRYKGKYVKIIKTFDYEKGYWLYEVIKVYREIHENTTLGEDVGTDYEYCR